MMPSSVLVVMASPLESITASMSWAASNTLLWALASRAIVDAPMTVPLESQMGETVNKAGNIVRSLRTRTV